MPLLQVTVVLLIFLLQSGVACSSELRMIILDVGMGQSIVLEKEGHGILIDSGPAPDASHVLKRLQAYGIHSLDYLILTHLHPDHAAGYPRIRQKWSDTAVLWNCHNPGPIDGTSEELLIKKTRARLKDDPLQDCLAAGDTLNWQGLRLQVLWPKEPVGSNLNAMSLVLLISTEDGRSILVMGDAGKDVERKLAVPMQTYLQGKRLDLYIAGHHAADDSTGQAFLKLLKPVFSAVSVGRSNPYGYPSDRAVGVLRQFSGRVFRTDLDGEICFRLQDQGIIPCK